MTKAVKFAQTTVVTAFTADTNPTKLLAANANVLKEQLIKVTIASPQLNVKLDSTETPAISVKIVLTLFALNALMIQETVLTVRKDISRWAVNVSSNLAIVNIHTDQFLTPLDVEDTTMRRVDFFHLTLKPLKKLIGVSGVLLINLFRKVRVVHAGLSVLQLWLRDGTPSSMAHSTTYPSNTWLIATHLTMVAMVVGPKSRCNSCVREFI